jgi:hypothetical protein
MASEALIAAIRKQYDEQGRRKVEVPEWGMTIWASPLTLGEQAKMHEFRSGAAGKQYLVFAQILIMKAEDEAGNKLFSQKDADMLTNHADPEVVSRVGTELIKAHPDTEVEEIKNG